MTFSILAVRQIDSPTDPLYPRPGRTPDTVEAEPGDGEPRSIRVSSVIVVEHRPDGTSAEVASFDAAEVAAAITDVRVTLCCSKYQPGAVAQPDPTSSLVGHVRYEWLNFVDGRDRSAASRSGRLTLWLVTPDGVSLSVELALGRDAAAELLAEDIALRAAFHAARYAGLQGDEAQVLPIRSVGVDGTIAWEIPQDYPPPTSRRSSRQYAADSQPPVATAAPCAQCGRGLRSGVASCAFCGAPVQPPVSFDLASDSELTTDRAAVMAAAAESESTGVVSMPAHGADVFEPSLDTVASCIPESRTPPPELWVAATALLLGAGSLLYPSLRYGIPLVPDLGSSDTYARALSALVLSVLVYVLFLGGSLLALAVALLRGSRVARTLTALVCGAVAVLVLAFVKELSGQAHVQATAVVVALACGAVVVLVTLPSGARSFFAGQQRTPAGVAVVTVIGSAYGWAITGSGLLILPVGSLNRGLAVFGLFLVGLGIVIALVARPLRSGSPSARTMATLAWLGYLIVAIAVAAKSGTSDYVGVFLAAGMLLVAVVGLWVLPESVRFFATDQSRSGPANWSPSPYTAAASAVVFLIAVVLGGINLSSHPADLDTAAQGTLATDQPTFAPPSDTGLPTEMASQSDSGVMPAPSYTPGYTALASLPGGDAATITISLGSPAVASSVTDSAVASCDDDLSSDNSTEDRTLAIPIEIMEQVTSNLSVSVSVGVGSDYDVSAQDQISSASLLLAAHYTDGSQCDDGTDSAANVQWQDAQPGSGGTFYGWLLLPGTITPDDPDGSAASSVLLIQPSITLNGNDANVSVSGANADAVTCTSGSFTSENSSYVAIDPAVAIQDGCTR